MMTNFIQRHIELVAWITGLLLLALADPTQHHFTLCIWHHLGFDFCPGCGLGRSVAYLFRLDLAASWQQHPLGIFAIIVLFVRIKNLLTNLFYERSHSHQHPQY
jgi:hypothetical protein